MCFLVLLAVFAPRAALFVLWIFTPLMSKAFDTFVFPLIGFLFAPYTTLFYALAVAPLGQADFWGWFSVGIGVLLDVNGYAQGWMSRNETPWATTTTPQPR